MENFAHKLEKFQPLIDSLASGSFHQELPTLPLTERPDSRLINKDFGQLSLGDVNADIQDLSNRYNDANPDTGGQERFGKRLEELSKTNYGKQFIETLTEASSKPPAEAGKLLAEALRRQLEKRFENSVVNFDQADNEFGVVAGMVRIIGASDSAPGGAKELLVNSFNQESSRSFVNGEKASSGTATGIDNKTYKASPLMVLYDEPGRPPGMLAVSDNQIVNPLRYTGE